MSDRQGWITPAFFVLFGLLWSSGAGAATDAEDSSAGASATPAQSVFLEYRELPYSVGSWTIPVTLQSAPFKKEPDLGQGKVYRGTLKFGDSTKAFVPFVWDQARGKLHLDLNRNQDLTDDADGVFASMGGPDNSFQNFGRVHLPFETPLGTGRVAVDLFFNDFRATPNVTAMAYYCWEAKVTQGGQEWQVALVESLLGKIGSADNGSLVLRPWADRGKAIDLQYGSLDFLPLTHDVFLGQRACHLDFALAQQDNKLKYKLNLAERPEQLGELRITGRYIHRLVLTRMSPGPASGDAAQAAFAQRYGVAGRAVPARTPSLRVILDSPGPVVRIPVGFYLCQLSLKQGAVETVPLLNSGPNNPNAGLLAVSATNAATLAFGGPLTNSVAVTRRGRSLALSYRLLGAQGEAYQLQGPRKEPQFAIYRPGKSGDKKLASGRFQFG
ncbi:MAG: hypothetical protein ACLQM8_07100 [Limisphaerales bacterium]